MQRPSRNLRWFACVVVVLAVGCGGGPGGGDDGPGPDAGPPCETVCFRWLPDPPPPPPPGPGEPARIEYDECNPYGLKPGVCPPLFTCGGVETFMTATLSVKTPVCSPSRPAPHVLDMDLAPAPIPPGALQAR